MRKSFVNIFYIGNSSELSISGDSLPQDTHFFSAFHVVDALNKVQLLFLADLHSLLAPTHLIFVYVAFTEDLQRNIRI